MKSQDHIRNQYELVKPEPKRFGLSWAKLNRPGLKLSGLRLAASKSAFAICTFSVLLIGSCSFPATANANPAVNGDPYVDELLTNACVSENPYWSGIKEQLTNGRYDDAIKLCRTVMARTVLNTDMHCMYAMALEIKLRKEAHDSALFDECVKEWTHVAKVKVLSESKGWEHIGDGEVFVENRERKNLAVKHLISLVGRAPKMFESEQAFLDRAIRVNTQVAGEIKKTKPL